MVMNNSHIKLNQATMNDNDESRTVSSFFISFKETDASFLEFDDELNNAGRSSLVGDNLELEKYVHKNGKISIIVVPGAEKPISAHAIRFSQDIAFFVLDFNDQAMNRFVEHQMLTSFKEFKAKKVEEVKVMIEQQRVELEEAKRMIEEQRMTSELQTQQMKEMKKMIEEMSPTQRGP
ncbi:CACTA en-spm transposon protein [Cucumis melo var. makuwa]|uniref:CACTA en-spm transposon protein n=1 Tax=Cucumis melo var. makuwa TaxID=1194695 RepID=A0A5D3DEK4_CUCMM|nr:CACTA en-spm transposon protein [Cucumis melo var. makuwa]